VAIPDTAVPGTKANVLVTDAVSSRAVDMQFDPGFYRPKDVAGLVAALGRVESNKNMIVRASFTEQGLREHGAALPSLPPSALSVMQYSPGEARRTPLMRDVHFSVETPWVLTGSQMVTITIEEPDPEVPE
jgi:hypothetical protein